MQKVKLIWLNSAVDDVVRLREFIASSNPKAAQKAAQILKQSAAKLVEFPNVGKPVENLPGYRNLNIRFGAAGYVIRYRIHKNNVYIVHLRHYREHDFLLSVNNLNSI